MEDILLTLSVTVLFIARIGIPMIILIGLGVALDRWQNHREQSYTQSHPSESSADR